MKIEQFVKLLTAIDEIIGVVNDLDENRYADTVIVSEEQKALKESIGPLLKDLIGKFLNHAEKYLKIEG